MRSGLYNTETKCPVFFKGSPIYSNSHPQTSSPYKYLTNYSQYVCQYVQLGAWKTLTFWLWLSFLCYLPQTCLGAAILAPVTYWPDRQVSGESHMSAAGGPSQLGAMLWRWSAQSEPRLTQHWGTAGKGASLFTSLSSFSVIFLSFAVDNWWDGTLSTAWFPCGVCISVDSVLKFYSWCRTKQQLHLSWKILLLLRIFSLS